MALSHSHSLPFLFIITDHSERPTGNCCKYQLLSTTARCEHCRTITWQPNKAENLLKHKVLWLSQGKFTLKDLGTPALAAARL